ncbi:MAG: response regulator [Candidatus Marinimicrobia bacterium]|nr:response regulator [Candidatus Neomarinimicrobiota bacterium]
MTALVVEDDFASRKYLILLLKKMNIEAVVAENGESGLDLAKDRDFDIMLLDIALGPGIDGIELCTRLKKQPRFAKTPPIAVTAFAQENLEKFEAAGFAGYLSKPYTSDQLKSALDKYL